MPGIFDRTISRKEFILDGVRTFGAMSLLPAVSLRAAEDAADGALRMALLSDTHIPEDASDAYRGFLPVENLKRVVPQVQSAQPQGVIINGDAARLDGKRGDYVALQSILQPLAEQAPIYVGLGNHDDRSNFFHVFGETSPHRQAVSQRHTLRIESDVVRIVVLDSLLYVNRVAGLLGKAQRAWLDTFLGTASAKPTVFFVHHTLGDGDGDLLDVDRLFEILRPHKFVQAIFYGHSHTYAVTEREGIKLINLPAVGYNFADKEPVGWIDATFTQRGVRMTLRAIGGNRTDDGKTTSVDWS